MSIQRRIVDDALYAHFVTFSVYRRRRLLDHDQPKRIVLGVLNDLLEKTDSRCGGFVLMPNHMHAVLWFPQPGQLSHFRHEWKRTSSLNIRKWYRDEADHYASRFGEGDRFRQPKYYAFEIFSRQKLAEKLVYMHQNPIRAGLVEQGCGLKMEFCSLVRVETISRSADSMGRWGEPLATSHTGRLQSQPTAATPRNEWTINGKPILTTCQ